MRIETELKWSLVEGHTTARQGKRKSYPVSLWCDSIGRGQCDCRTQIPIVLKVNYVLFYTYIVNTSLQNPMMHSVQLISAGIMNPSHLTVPRLHQCHCWRTRWSESTPAYVVSVVGEGGAREWSPSGPSCVCGRENGGNTCVGWLPSRFQKPLRASVLRGVGEWVKSL